MENKPDILEKDNNFKKKEITLKINNLTFKYGNTVSLNNINLELYSGRIVGLLGPNGSGKTTLIKIINDLLNGYEGEITVCGNKIGHLSKSDISYLPDIDYLEPDMKLKSVIKIFKLLFKDFDVNKAEDLATKLNLDLNMKVKKASKGTREKFNLIMALSRNVKLYILDEPIAGVDPAARDLILDTILKNYNKDATILMSTHLISDIENILDDYIFIKNGVIVDMDSADNGREKYGMSIDERFREVFRC